MRGAVLVVLAVAVLAGAPQARADTYCVGVGSPGCTAEPTAADAFSAARADTATDTILLGRLEEAGAFADATGRPVHVVGLGANTTVLRPAPTGTAPTLRLADPDSTALGLRVEGPPDRAALLLDAGGSVRSAVVAGPLRVRGGPVELSSVVVAGASVSAGCDTASASVILQHVTVAGSGAAGVSASCSVAGRSVALRVADSIVWGFGQGFALGPGATLGASYSDWPGGSGGTNRDQDPGFMGLDDVRLRPDSPLVDTGTPGVLTNEEPHEDALGFVRAVDGNGDGIARRDVGALELQPAPPPAPPGNVLTNGGAEAGTPAQDDTSSPAPPGWTRTGSFTFVRYGTVAGQFPFPTRRVGEALAAGDAFFAGGPQGGGTASQVADVSSSAPEVDRGLGTVSLSALLGGYRTSGDGAVVEAEFRNPAGRSLGVVRIGPVSAADRAGASNLLPRSATAAIPRLTRSIEVTLRSTPPTGSYDDAYLDRVALVPRIAGGRLFATPPPPPGRRLKPYGGIVVMTPRTAVDSRGRAWVRLGCATRTVGRCRGVITLTSPLGTKVAHRIGRALIDVRAGHVMRVAVKLRRSATRALRRGRLRARLYAATRDGQGVTRTSTAPVRVVRGHQRRRR